LTVESYQNILEESSLNHAVSSGLLSFRSSTAIGDMHTTGLHQRCNVINVTEAHQCLEADSYRKAECRQREDDTSCNASPGRPLQCRLRTPTAQEPNLGVHAVDGETGRRLIGIAERLSAVVEVGLTPIKHSVSQ